MQLRIQRQIEEFKKNESTSGFKVQIIDKQHWKGYITGPKDTPYQGGFYQLDVILPQQYPYKPPKVPSYYKMKFDTKIWHPNISSVTGVICLDVLGKQWSPALSVRTALLSIQALLCSPQPDDPQDGVVAGQYKSNKNAYIKQAKEWVQKYASEKILEQKIKKICEMGFEKGRVKQVLQKHGYEEQPAIQELISSI